MAGAPHQDWLDPNLAAVHVELLVDADGSSTNAADLLVRADQLHADESGEHPGERFAAVSLQRAEVLALLQLLEDDWQDHCRYAAPLEDTAPLMTTQTRARVGVLLKLLDEAAQVLDTIEPEDSDEADHLSTLVAGIRDAAASFAPAHAGVPS